MYTKINVDKVLYKTWITVLDQSAQGFVFGGWTLVHGIGRSARLLGQYSRPCDWAQFG